MELELKTLTPLWTGGIEGKVDHIHETGIIGSLRWWFEVFVRGLGGMVNDPTKDERSIYDPDKAQATEDRNSLRVAGLCDVSQVFGATGWRRRFHLRIIDQSQWDITSPKKISSNRTNPNTKQHPTWWFNDHPRSGNITIQVQSLDQGFPAEVIGGLVQFITDWAAVGAKAQMGFGVVEPLNGRIDTPPLYKWLEDTAGTLRYPGLPSLQNIFLARIQLQNANDLTEEQLEERTFDLKVDLRQLFRNNADLRHFIMGTVKDGKMAAKVKMSRPYNDGLIRVWGWIPEQADFYNESWDRDTVVDAIYQHLNTKYTLQVWREINSPRDTVQPNNGDAKVFLKSLLGLEEEDNAV